MTHYICTGGCKGVSELEGTCQMADCPKHEQPMQECSCEDGLHGKAPTSEGAEETPAEESAE